MSPEPQPNSDRVFLISTSVAVALTLAAHVFGAFTLKTTFWGVHIFGFFHPAVLLVLSVMTVVLCSWIVMRPVVFRGVVETTDTRLDSRLVPAVLVVIGTMLFWVFRVRDTYLGDGTILINSVADGQVFHPREPLIMAAQQLIYRGLSSIAGQSRDAVLLARDAVALGSVISGALFILVAWQIARCIVALRRAPTKGLEVLLVTLLLLLQGYVLLFFGYIENYAMYALITAVYLWLSLRFLQGRGPLLFPALAATVGVGMHIASVILWPSLAVLAIWAMTHREMRWGAVRDLVIAGLCLIGLHFLLGALKPGFSFTSSLLEATGLAVTREQERVPLLSWVHIRDFLNEQMLIGPLGLLLFAASTITLWTAKQWRRATVVFLVTAAAGHLAAAWLAGDSNLGYARDWDVWASSGLVMTTAALGLFLSASASSRAAFPAIACALIISLYHTAPWVAVNASASRSLARLKTLPLGFGRTEVLVSQWYRDRGNDEQRRLWLEKAIIENPSNNNAHYLLGIYYAESGDMRRAADSFRRATELRPDKPLFHQQLADALIASEQYEEAIPHLEFELARDRENAAGWARLGETLRKAGRPDEAQSVFERALAIYRERLDTVPDDFASNLGCGWLLYSLARYDEALPYLNHALVVRPQSDSALCLLGYALRALERGAEAAPLFRRCLDANPSRPDRATIEAWLDVGDE